MDKTVAPPPTPKIDPELLEMEAERGAQETIIEKIQKLVGRRPHVKETPHGPRRDRKHGKTANEDRWKRRVMARAGDDYKPDPRTQPHARLGRARAKKSQAQINWEFREQARRALSRIKLTVIQPHCPDIRFVVGVPGLRTVWQLSQATNATMHAIPGLGPKRRQAILKYLHEHNVPTAWTA